LTLPLVTVVFGMVLNVTDFDFLIPVDLAKGMKV
jgi:hypothetical protein